MRDESRAVNPPCNCGGDLAEYGRGLNHRSRDPMQTNRSDISFRVDKRIVLGDRLQCPGVERNCCNFDDTIVPSQTGSLAVNDNKPWSRSSRLQSLRPYVQGIHLTRGLAEVRFTLLGLTSLLAGSSRAGDYFGIPAFEGPPVNR